MKAVSPLIGMVLVVAFGFAAMGIVLTVVRPLLDSAKDSGLINEATQNMQLVDSAVKAVASEPKGSKRTINIKITDGVLRTDDTVDWVYVDYEPKSRMKLDGFTGDVRIESSPFFLEYFNNYADGSNANSTWYITNGTWSISSGRFLGTGGIAYHNIGNRTGFELSSSVIPSTAPHGQVYAVPGDPRDLVLYLPFDGNINTTERIAYDYSAYQNNATLYNRTLATCFTNNACPSWVNGRFGNATSYDGVGDVTNMSYPMLDGAFYQGGTFFAWINPASDGQNNLGRVADTGSNWQMYVSSESGNAVYLVFGHEMTGGGNVDGVWRTTTRDITLNTWTSIAVIYDNSSSSNDPTIYINGQPVSVTETTTPVGTPRSEDQRINIGNHRTLDRAFDGSIDEVMIFNRSLTPNEISFLYESSIKKITSAGEIQSIGSKENVTLVLSSPGSTYFDNVKVKAGASLLRFVVPYDRIDIANSTRFGVGDHTIVVKNYGINTTTNRPIISIEKG